MFPDEGIRIFVFVALFLFSFHTFMSFAVNSFDDLDEFTEMRSMDEIPQCDFEHFEDPDYQDLRRIFSLPAEYGGLLPVWLNPFVDEETIWYGRGSYQNYEVFPYNVSVGSSDLYLMDGKDAGSYIVRYDLTTGFIWDDMEGIYLGQWDHYYNIDENQTFIWSWKIVDNQGNVSDEGDLVFSYDDIGVEEFDESSYSQTIDYEITDEDQYLQLSIFLISDDYETFGSPIYDSFVLQGAERVKPNIKDFVDCSIMVILEWGRAGFIDSGIGWLDTIFFVFGSLGFIVSILIAVILMLISIGAQVLIWIGII